MAFLPCRITVVQKSLNKDVMERHVSPSVCLQACCEVSEGQVFRVENPFLLPDGICPWAWADIRAFILALAAGADFSFMKNKASVLASCSDPLRPVVFLIERLE